MAEFLRTPARRAEPCAARRRRARRRTPGRSAGGARRPGGRSSALSTTWCSTPTRRAMPRGSTITMSCESAAGALRASARRRGRHLRRGPRRRHRARHGRADARTHLRSLLHDQGASAAAPDSGAGDRCAAAFAKDAGGHVDVTSTPERGTTFTLRAARARGRAARGRDRRPPHRTAPAGRDGRILVVEDRDDVRANVVRTLATRGYEVDEAADGDSALALLGNGNGCDGDVHRRRDAGSATADVIERAAALAPGHGRRAGLLGLRRAKICSGAACRPDAAPSCAKPFTADQLLAGVDGVFALSSAADAPRD